MTSLLSMLLLFLATCVPSILKAEPTEPLVPNTMQARVAACVTCHGADGRAGPDGFYPRIAGKPAGYLLAQLISFRDGERRYDPMRHLLEGLSDEYLGDIAQYFAEMHLPYSEQSLARFPPSMLEKGRTLAETGDASRELPACAACHGSSFAGIEPNIPGLLGLPRDYIIGQLGSWRTGLRRAAQPDCMAHVAKQLTPEDIAAVSAWLVAQPIEEPYVAAPAGTFSLPTECGSVVTSSPLQTSDNTSAEEQIEIGRYLALAGNCMGCHTVPDGEHFAGGTPISTDFGTLYGPNITPSTEHGIGAWTADDFWNAMHDGKAPDGTPLYPAFPYPQYTHMTRSDTDAIYAYLLSLPAFDTPRRPHDLDFPYNQRRLLTLWRAVYFEPGTLEPDPSQDKVWNRGRYLVEGLGHCAACHTPRNQWHANDLRRSFEGAAMMDSQWYATPLTGDAGGLGNWSSEDIVQLLRTGISKHGTAAGPMSEIVSDSTQYLRDDDLNAMATYLKSLPPRSNTPSAPRASEYIMTAGGKLYEQHCVLCHQASGEGSLPAWPPLAGNSSVLAESPNNVVLMLLKGGYAPTTQDNPMPHGMPPYHALSDSEIAALATYIRNSWGNQAGAVDAHQIAPLR